MKKMLGLAAAAAVALPIVAPAAAMADEGSSTSSQPNLSSDMRAWGVGGAEVGGGAATLVMSAVHGLPLYVLGGGFLPPTVNSTLGWTNDESHYYDLDLDGSHEDGSK